MAAKILNSARIFIKISISGFLMWMIADLMSDSQKKQHGGSNMATKILNFTSIFIKIYIEGF